MAQAIIAPSAKGKRVAERPTLETILSDKVVKVQSRLLKAQAETREAVGEKKRLLQKIADLRHYWLQDVANRQEAHDRASALLQQQISQAQSQVDAVLLDKQKVEVRLSKAETKFQLPESILTNDWKLGKPIGRGSNGHILTATNPEYPTPF
ncbi:hypothetical protein WJX82_008057 [Trebouxia sp. C0006]